MSTISQLSGKFFDIVKGTGGDWESDKLCFKKSLETFLKSGSKEDAFVVYFCFSEIFKLFGEGYDNTQKLLELLSDHEYHSGELLNKHRDHYSHSVYVFAIGLAIYANDSVYRKTFLDFYDYSDNDVGALNFLHSWGLVSLFHDIGYPYQLAHEQIKGYNEELWGKGSAAVFPYVSFGNIESFIAIDEKTQERLNGCLSEDYKFDSLNSLLAYGLNLREGYDCKEVCDELLQRVIRQKDFMDHGYFSAVILAKKLLLSPNFTVNNERVDVLTAILLHNNFNKYSENARHPISLDEHPLAYLLILCDELQVWDRMAYGKASKRDPIAWSVEFNISDNAISATYNFDSCAVLSEDGKTRINKSFEEIQSDVFVCKILGGEVEKDDKVKKYEGYISSGLVITAKAVERKKEKKTQIYASDNSFINLCDFAKAIHASYCDLCKNTADRINDDFSKLSLEFKVSNIEQAKSYAQKLELINCFYSSKDLDYPVVEDFKKGDYGTSGSDNLGFLCREEHLRWVREKINQGWKYGEKGKDFYSTEDRNKKKFHNCLVPYELLSEEDRKKDELMIENIIPMLKKFGNNIRIYAYRSGRKPDLVVAGIGHRYYSDSEKKLKEKVTEILQEYSKTHRVIVRTGFAYGADQLIAECANELGLTVKATLPYAYDDFIEYVRKDALENGVDYTADDEMRLRLLLSQTAVFKEFSAKEDSFVSCAKYNIDKCDKVIALWDGAESPLFDREGNPVNRGGTYHCLKMAEERGLRFGDDIRIVRCHR
ncbi:MAG: hypothetical protein LUD27_02835 [Clostridia bacterium]|nr:hypothetical protein [Clostridia bacterium]